MKRSLIAVGIAATVGAAAAAQQPQQQPQSQQQQQSQQQKPSASKQGQSMTLTGCVYQTTDQPTNFALQRTDAISGPSAAGTSGSSGASSGTTPGATSGTSGTTGAAGSAAGARDQGAWYRLSSSATQDLKQYVGRAVRISGTVIPGKDEKGADVVVHHIEPGKVTVTALDLKPAPQLQIQSITQAQGQCTQGSSNK
jgi:hypothetical protein